VSGVDVREVLEIILYVMVGIGSWSAVLIWWLG
jgi:hypothetical protein